MIYFFTKDYHYLCNLNTNLHAFISVERIRAEADTRDDLPSYSEPNLTLIEKGGFKNMKTKASLNNLLNKEYEVLR